MTIELCVGSGEVKAHNAKAVLRAPAIGSCVVVAGYDPLSGVGGMAHVMLPGDSGSRSPAQRAGNADEAMEELLHQMAVLGADEAPIRACLVGGANLLGEGHDTPGPEIVQSLIKILDSRGIELVAADVGGMERRSCMLDVDNGRVTYTVGDSEPRVLWEAAEDDTED